MTRPLIIDCDPGHDDALALLLAVASPTLDLKAVTTCFGNCSVEDATRNALRILTLAGATHMPVAKGASGPLTGELALGNYVHGVSGLDGPDLPEPGMEVVAQDAVELLADVLRDSEEKVTLAVTGPMTNMARLLQQHPELTPRIDEIIFMGGSTERGNHTPTAEFNTYADPEALDVVLRTGVPVRMIGLNLTHQALATPEVVQRMSDMQHSVGQICAGWMGFFGDSYRKVWEFDAPPVHDPCTIVALIDPGVVTWREAFLAVELEGRWTRGTTVVDLHERYPDQAPNAQVATVLDRDGYWRIVLEALDKLGAAA
ncbi:nucleoside hydrolase [Ornithinimicrobium panacihumi]|uniref:nucleoside hydrolase n=1 Tax=Ornithinimicrobium panacihumi TaxID=2008449 RepID=UPI003F8887E6